MREMTEQQYVYRQVAKMMEKKYMGNLLTNPDSIDNCPPIRRKPQLPRLPDMDVAETINFIYKIAEERKVRKLRLEEERRSFIDKLKGSIVHKVKEVIRNYPEFKKAKKQEGLKRCEEVLKSPFKQFP